MCYYYAITKSKIENLIEAQITSAKQLSLLDEVFFANGFDNPQLPVITCEQPDEIQLFQWGLIPSWVKDQSQADQLRAMTLNAKVETVFEKRSFSSNVLNRRCLVLCSGFFENFTKTKKEKYSFYISRKDESIFCLAGIYDQWTNPTDGKVYKTYSILTQSANELLSAIHNTQQRQPVILDYENAKKYISNDLQQAEIETIINTRVDFRQLQATPIAHFNPKNAKALNQAKVSAYYHFPELVTIFRFDPNFTEEVIRCVRTTMVK